MVINIQPDEISNIIRKQIEGCVLEAMFVNIGIVPQVGGIVLATLMSH